MYSIGATPHAMRRTSEKGKSVCFSRQEIKRDRFFFKKEQRKEEEKGKKRKRVGIEWEEIGEGRLLLGLALENERRKEQHNPTVIIIGMRTRARI